MRQLSPDESDIDLVNHLRAGSSEALGILYDRYSGLVYSIALKMLTIPGEAEDLTQEIFLTFWKQEKFDPSRAALSTYLCVMTRSRALNRISRRSSRQRTLQRLQQGAPPIEWTLATPLEKAALAEQAAILKTALTQLPERQRQILEMNYYKGMSQSKIAQALSMPLGTVKTNSRQALIRLRQLLKDAIG